MVLSIDDDLIIPCDDLEFALGVWSTSKRYDIDFLDPVSVDNSFSIFNPHSISTVIIRALVGFSPRMHVRDMWTGALRYLRWQHTFWNGAYSIVLTKAAFFHQDYLLDFRKTIPESLLQYVDKHRNCEDIFMAYVIALKVVQLNLLFQ